MLANVNNVNVDRIKSRAKCYGITLKYLNSSIGKHDSFLSCVRNGTDHIDEDELATIAKIIHTTVAYLTDQTDDPELPSEHTEKVSSQNAVLLADDEIELLEAYRQLSKSKKRQLLGKAYELLDSQNNPQSAADATPPDIDLVTSILDGRVKK